MLYFQRVGETCILISEMITLVTISNVWNSSEGQEERPHKTLYCVVGMYRNICYLDLWIYFGYFEGKIVTEFFHPDGQIFHPMAKSW